MNDWFHGTLHSRLDNKKIGSIVVVMQRMHLHDLAGHILENSGWMHLSPPAIAEDDEAIALGEGKLHYRHAGDALHPEREPLEILENMRAQMGPDLFAAQYQQRPVPPGGRR